MLRGINQTQLFYDDLDRETFLDRLFRYKQQCGFCLYAYSLMGNHVHMLLKPEDTILPAIIQRLTLSYSHYYNTRYDRKGYLFQGRYRCLAVQDDSYFFSVLRYIHNNPVEAGLPINYWTSYDEYMDKPVIVDTTLALGMLGDSPPKARKAFSELMLSSGDGNASPIEQQLLPRLLDARAVEIIKTTGAVDYPGRLAELEPTEQKKLVALLRGQGISVRQLSRLTGISRGIIQKVKPTKGQ
jgi:REP element-mobilizing transposase RayT